MNRIKINGISVQVEDHWTLLEACRFYGIDIPTFCYYTGLSYNYRPIRMQRWADYVQKYIVISLIKLSFLKKGV